jgi:hypothetical protein
MINAKFFKFILLKKYFGNNKINAKKINIYNDSNLVDIEMKNNIEKNVKVTFLFGLLLFSLDKYINAKQTLAPAAKILAPV